MKGRLKTLGSRVATAPSRVGTVQPGSWRGDKQTSTQRGYGYRWQKVRAAFLAANPLCVMCEREGRITVATVVDHVIPHRGDERLMWDEANLQTLCASHHSRDKQRDEQR